MKIETTDGQRKIVVDGMRSLRVVASEDIIKSMSNGSLKLYREAVYLFFDITQNQMRSFEQNAFDTIWWLKKSVDREWVMRKTAAYNALIAARRSSRSFLKGYRYWYKSDYADAYKLLKKG